jgi:hypothetical protein
MFKNYNGKMFIYLKKFFVRNKVASNILGIKAIAIKQKTKKI